MSDLKNVFQKPITEIIRERKSVRSYKNDSLKDSDKEKLTAFIEDLTCPLENTVRIKIMDSKLLMNKSNIKLGTYGIIKGASSFVVSASQNTETDLLALGYKLEKFILFATSLGLGTCWLGGTFKKSEFSKAMELKEVEILPIVSPIGYPSENRRLVDSIMRAAAGSNNRSPWEKLFFEDSFNISLTERAAEAYQTPLEMLRLAPSASNKQPWRIVKQNNILHFYINHAKGYSSSLGFDMQKIDMGIAMCHLELACEEHGINGRWERLNPAITIPEDSIEYIISWIGNLQ